jgi:hypothetical protein
MFKGPLGSIVFLCLMVACTDDSDPKVNPIPVEPPQPEPALKIWSPEASAILLEKLGGPYAKELNTPGLFLEKEEMTDAQLDALEQWSLHRVSSPNCKARDVKVAYQATIFDNQGGQQVFLGNDQGCVGEVGNAHYVPSSFFQNFPGDVPYHPESAGDYTLEKVSIYQHILKIDVRHSEGCASYRNFMLMLDPKATSASQTVILAYLRHRTDDKCEAMGRTHLEFDLTQYDLGRAKFIKLKDWSKLVTLPTLKH